VSLRGTSRCLELWAKESRPCYEQRLIHDLRSTIKLHGKEVILLHITSFNYRPTRHHYFFSTPTSTQCFSIHLQQFIYTTSTSIYSPSLPNNTLPCSQQPQDSSSSSSSLRSSVPFSSTGKIAADGNELLILSHWLRLRSQFDQGNTEGGVRSRFCEHQALRFERRYCRVWARWVKMSGEGVVRVCVQPWVVCMMIE